MLELFVLAVSLVLSALFFLYGYNSFYILINARRYRAPAVRGLVSGRPSVAVHLPIYNERYVVARLLEACARMAEEYGKKLVRIVVLDDSDDDTSSEVDRAVDGLSRRGVKVEVQRRGGRRGFKAGALQEALTKTSEKYLAIFDADFVPPRDFLSNTVPYLEADPQLAIVQHRWGHLNRDYSLLTRAVSLGIDGHFFQEQPGRFQARCFLNFNGSGGVLRVKALQEAGGWHSDTLAEDLDMSYRVQMLGYRILYLKELAAPAEVPPTVAAFKQQQARWARGSLRTARKLLPTLLRDGRFSLRQKFEAYLHLTYYLVHPLILGSFLLASVAAVFNLDVISPKVQNIVDVIGSGGSSVGGVGLLGLWVLFGGAIVVCWLAVWSYYVLTLREQRMGVVQNVPSLVLLGFLGYGVSVSNTLHALKAFVSKGGVFSRTPKYGVERKGDSWRGRRYQVPLSFTSILEAGALILGVFSVMYAVSYQNWGVVPILMVYVLSFGLVLVAGLAQSDWGQRLGSS